jgi:hypothetical protein
MRDDLLRLRGIASHVLILRYDVRPVSVNCGLLKAQTGQHCSTVKTKSLKVLGRQRGNQSKSNYANDRLQYVSKIFNYRCFGGFDIVPCTA